MWSRKKKNLGGGLAEIEVLDADQVLSESSRNDTLLYAERHDKLSEDDRVAYGSLIASILHHRYFSELVESDLVIDDLSRFQESTFDTTTTYEVDDRVWARRFLDNLLVTLDIKDHEVPIRMMLEITCNSPENIIYVFKNNICDKSDIMWIIQQDIVCLSICTGVYDSRARYVVENVCRLYELPWESVVYFEEQLGYYLIEKQKELGEIRKIENDKKKMINTYKKVAYVSAAAVVGGTLLGVTGGLAAPATVGAAALLGAGSASTFLASTSGVVLTTSLWTGAGLGLGGRAMANRMGAVSECTFEPMTHIPGRLHVLICITGWVSSIDDDFTQPWSELDDIGEQYSLRWESKELSSFFVGVLSKFTSEAISFATQQVLAHTFLSGVLFTLFIPLQLLRLTNLVDHPWGRCIARADKVGFILADLLSRHVHGNRPVSLIGYSFGARIIFTALEYLAKRKIPCKGLIENVYLLGAPVPNTKSRWQKIASVVGGKVYNCYSTKDWILKVVYRTASAQIKIAGLTPVKDIKNVENVDMSDIVGGHLDYHKKNHRILHFLKLTKSEPPSDDIETEEDIYNREMDEFFNRSKKFDEINFKNDEEKEAYFINMQRELGKDLKQKRLDSIEQGGSGLNVESVHERDIFQLYMQESLQLKMDRKRNSESLLDIAQPAWVTEAAAKENSRPSSPTALSATAHSTLSLMNLIEFDCVKDDNETDSESNNPKDKDMDNLQSESQTSSSKPSEQTKVVEDSANFKESNNSQASALEIEKDFVGSIINKHKHHSIYRSNEDMSDSAVSCQSEDFFQSDTDNETFGFETSESSAVKDPSIFSTKGNNVVINNDSNNNNNISQSTPIMDNRSLEDLSLSPSTGSLPTAIPPATTTTLVKAATETTESVDIHDIQHSLYDKIAQKRRDRSSSLECSNISEPPDNSLIDFTVPSVAEEDPEEGFVQGKYMNFGYFASSSSSPPRESLDDGSKSQESDFVTPSSPLGSKATLVPSSFIPPVSTSLLIPKRSPPPSNQSNIDNQGDFNNTSKTELMELFDLVDLKKPK